MTRTVPGPGQLHMSGATRQQRLYDCSIELLRFAVPPEGYYLATSFGKDSIVAHRLCDEAGVKYDAHHNITGIDPPELVYFGRKHYPDVERHMYKMIDIGGRMVPGSMWRLIEAKGIPPMRYARYCCEALKEDGGRGRRCVMGIRAEESDRRKKNWAPLAMKGSKGSGLRVFDNDDIQVQLQQCATRNTLVVNPLYSWTWADLWDFIRDRRMPYCSLYDEGFDRLGCIGCPMAGEFGRKYEFERWPRFYSAYMRAFRRLIDAGRFSDKGSAEAIMEWWMTDAAQEKPIDGQVEMTL